MVLGDVCGGTFYSWRQFVGLRFVGGHFVAGVVLWWGTFCGEGRFVGRDVSWWDVLWRNVLLRDVLWGNLLY
jgi:hypothetical protein